MTQTQVMGHLADKVGISKKDAKLALDELNTLVVRELKKEGSIRRAGLVLCQISTPHKGRLLCLGLNNDCANSYT